MSARSLWFATLCSGAISACAFPAPNPVLEEGKWRGHIQYSAVLPPVGVLFEVGGSDRQPRIRLLVPPAAGLSGVELQEVRLEKRTLQFIWPRKTAWRCLLQADENRVFSGACTALDGREWQLRMVPPGRDDPPLGYASWLLANPEPGWLTREGNGIRVHVPRDGRTSAEIEELVTFAAEARRRNLEILGSAAARRLDLFLLKDREALARYLGRAHGGMADPLGSAAIASGYGSAKTVIVHELMHVLSFNAWGEAAEPSAWLTEGLATHAAGQCAGYPIAQVATHLAAAGKLLPTDALLHRFWEQDDVIAYIQSAGLVGYLLEHYGRDVVRTVWREGATRLERTAGLSFEEVHARWERSLRTSDVSSGAVRMERIYSHGCG